MHNAQVLCKCGMKDSFSNEPTGGRFMGNRGTILVISQILLCISNIALLLIVSCDVSDKLDQVFSILSLNK